VRLPPLPPPTVQKSSEWPFYNSRPLAPLLLALRLSFVNAQLLVFFQRVTLSPGQIFCDGLFRDPFSLSLPYLLAPLSVSRLILPSSPRGVNKRRDKWKWRSTCVLSFSSPHVVISRPCRFPPHPCFFSSSAVASRALPTTDPERKYWLR